MQRQKPHVYKVMYPLAASAVFSFNPDIFLWYPGSTVPPAVQIISPPCPLQPLISLPIDHAP